MWKAENLWRGFQWVFFPSWSHLEYIGLFIEKASITAPIPMKPSTYKITYRQKQHETNTLTIIDSFDLPVGALVEVEL